jgi:hypothetical protein
MQMYIETIEKANIGWNRDGDDASADIEDVEDVAEEKVTFFKKRMILLFKILSNFKANLFKIFEE